MNCLTISRKELLKQQYHHIFPSEDHDLEKRGADFFTAV